MDGVHDMGGMQGFGPVVVPGSDRVADEPWETRIFALSCVLDAERLSACGGRPVREELPPGEYLRESYYERWVFSTEQKVLRGGLVADDELRAVAARLAAGAEAQRRVDPDLRERVLATLRTPEGYRSADAPAFAVGDDVRVRRMRPEGHTRCPRYVRGAIGVVEAIRGADGFPDEGPEHGLVTAVYAVSFASGDLFGASDEPEWQIVLDLYEPYLDVA